MASTGTHDSGGAHDQSTAAKGFGTFDGRCAMKIFISYSRHDLATVEELVADLEASQHDVWRDERLNGGQEWWDRILEEIRGADLFVLALSQHSLSSNPCQVEFDYAARLNKRILPVRLDNRVTVQELPQALSQLQWVEYERGDKSAALRLVGSVQQLPPPVAMPSPEPERPPIPVSYLGDLRDRIGQPEALGLAEQNAIISELGARLNAQDDPIAIENLLGRLLRRNDIARPVRRQARALRKRIEDARPRPATARRDIRFLLSAAGGMLLLAGIVLGLVTFMDRSTDTIPISAGAGPEEQSQAELRSGEQGNEADPSPTHAPSPTATETPQPTTAPRPTSTPEPRPTATPRPAPTARPTPRPTLAPTSTQSTAQFQGVHGSTLFGWTAAGVAYLADLETHGQTGIVHVTYVDPALNRLVTVTQDLQLAQLDTFWVYVGSSPRSIDPVSYVADVFRLSPVPSGGWTFAEVCDFNLVCADAIFS